MSPLQSEDSWAKRLEHVGLQRIHLVVTQASDLTHLSQMESVEDLSLEELALLAGGLSGYMVSTGYTS